VTTFRKIVSSQGSRATFRKGSRENAHSFVPRALRGKSRTRRNGGKRTSTLKYIWRVRAYFGLLTVEKGVSGPDKTSRTTPHSTQRKMCSYHRGSRVKKQDCHPPKKKWITMTQKTLGISHVRTGQNGQWSDVTCANPSRQKKDLLSRET